MFRVYSVLVVLRAVIATAAISVVTCGFFIVGPIARTGRLYLVAKYAQRGSAHRALYGRFSISAAHVAFRIAFTPFISGELAILGRAIFIAPFGIRVARFRILGYFYLIEKFIALHQHFLEPKIRCERTILKRAPASDHQKIETITSQPERGQQQAIRENVWAVYQQIA